jgi:hypothetical protein
MSMTRACRDTLYRRATSLTGAPDMDLHHRVIALLHDAQLPEHGPATLPREQHRNGHAGAGGVKHQMKPLSTISRSRTASPTSWPD